MLVLESGATEAGAAASVDVCVWSFFLKKTYYQPRLRGFVLRLSCPPLVTHPL
jgi:hypothetical protein